MTVVDASAAVRLLLGGLSAEALRDRLLADDESLHAPALLDLEVTQVLRRYVVHGEMPGPRGAQAMQLLLELPVRRHAHGPLLARVWQLRENATAYDACYIALAEALRAPLVTCDAALASVPGVRAKVEVF